MITKPMDVLSDFPVRRSFKQKSAFISAVTAYAQRLQYPVTVENGKQHSRNIVIGDPHAAQYLITAHYDTPAASLLPNLMLPTNFAVYFLYQMAIVLSYMLIALAVCLPVTMLTKDSTTIFLVWYVAYMALVLLVRYGPANKNNYNDNTSGVVTLLEIARSLPQNQRDRVCFVLFDQEEKGLVGSSAYRKAHKDSTEKQIVLNLDCVGDGDIIQFVPVKNAKKDPVILENLSKICVKVGKKELQLLEGNATGSSDHKNFPNGVGIKALHYKKGIGLYCGRIHTKRDTILDQTNVNILRAVLITLIGSVQKQERKDEYETV